MGNLNSDTRLQFQFKYFNYEGNHIIFTTNANNQCFQVPSIIELLLYLNFGSSDNITYYV